MVYPTAGGSGSSPFGLSLSGRTAVAGDNWQTSTIISDTLPYKKPIKDLGDEVFRFTWFALTNDDRFTFWWLGFYEAFGFFAATRPIRRDLGSVRRYQHVHIGTPGSRF